MMEWANGKATGFTIFHESVVKYSIEWILGIEYFGKNGSPSGIGKGMQFPERVIRESQLVQFKGRLKENDK